MKRYKATRQDVARLAGVSTTTVTNVMNNKPNVSDDVKEKVRQVIQEINYTPNLIARSLITKQTHHIAVIMEDIADMHFGPIVNAFQKEATRQGYFVSICIRDNNLEALLESFTARGIDGVFMMISPSEKLDGGIDNTLHLIRKLSASGVKVVVGFGCYHDIEHFSTVAGDFGGAVASAVEYLAGLGHKQIGMLNIFDENYAFDNRSEKFRAAMKDVLNISNPPIIMGAPPYPAHMDTGEQYTQMLLEQYPDVTAIIGANDMLTIGAVSYLTENGYNVPDDMSVISIGDVPLLKHLKPAISAMAMNFDEYGKAAFDTLLDTIQSGNAHIVQHKFSLKIRSTTTVAPAKSKTKKMEA